MAKDRDSEAHTEKRRESRKQGSSLHGERALLVPPTLLTTNEQSARHHRKKDETGMSLALQKLKVWKRTWTHEQLLL